MIERKRLVSFGVCLGRFTKTKKFRLLITCLHTLTPFAKNKVWLKPSAEQSFVYGRHVLKAGLGRITEGVDKNQGVFVMSMSDVPLGFGVTAKSTTDCRRADPRSMVCIHQADVGEYLRQEDALV